ncbi:mitochondrial S-adenosylmethionine carrier protein-like isoform X2 [Choristoneura fumiferana]|uniref:mitochondrial S-adenosylmethionine carrier protein-like isoform X2 n=1 Tax=Choristoneura fumiferana TaxID=7141 RepID=UPI003D156F0E
MSSCELKMFGNAGAVAGLAVETGLYPLDTLKTRLQSAQGLHKSGGFKGVYKGLAPVAIASMPGAALFFVSYETAKALTEPLVPPAFVPVAHSGSAAIAELFACLIRVPTEIAKQRKQTYVGVDKRSSFSILYNAYKLEGIRRGLFRGYLSTVARDLPFGVIDIPIWEWLKEQVRRRNNGEVTSFQSACCGAAAAIVAGTVTTPFDVAKTRIILAEVEHTSAHSLRIQTVLRVIYREAGLRGLFAGCTTRVIALMLGSFVFFGVYEEVKSIVEKKLKDQGTI